MAGRPARAERPMTPQQTIFRPKWLHRLAVVVLMVATLATAWFGLRTYRSFLFLRTAYEAGAPMTSSIRGWMTLRYVATRYRVSEARLIMRLGLAPETDADTSLKSLAEKKGLAPIQYIQQIQQAVADVAPPDAAQPVEEKSDWLNRISGELLSALLTYGYPVMALILLFGAMGLPVPTGLSVAVAGSLAALGRMEWHWAAMIAVGASVLGDAAGYGVGRLLGRRFLEHYGRWFGYTPGRQARVQALLDQWGAWTIVVTRTLASHFSSVVSFLAGLARFRLSVFLIFDTIGRVIWTSAYFGLGYTIGGNFDAATDFLANLSGLLVSLLLLLLGGGVVASGQRISKPVS
jgi:membrane protein DedA with SNARE-associated domain